MIFSGCSFLVIVVCIVLGLIHGLNPLLFTAIVVAGAAGFVNLMLGNDGLP